MTSPVCTPPWARAALSADCRARYSRSVSLRCSRFTVPGDGGSLVRNTAFMRAVGDAQEMFRPGAPGAQLIPEMSELASGALVADNQKLSGLAGNNVVRWLLDRAISTVFITGVATNLTVEQTARHGTDLGFTVYVAVSYTHLTLPTTERV